MRRKAGFFTSWIVRVPRSSGGSVLAGVLLLCSLVAPLWAVAQTNFGTVNVGSSTTAAATVTFANSGTLASIAVVTQGATNLDYTEAGVGTCTIGTAYTVEDTCTVNVTFAPKFDGGRNGAVVLTDAGNNVLGTGYLQGTGAAPQLAYYIQSLTQFNTIPATLTGSPLAIAMDDSGSVYIADGGTTGTNSPGARVVKETFSAGKWNQSVLASGFYRPVNVAIDGAGNIYVLDTGAGQNTNTWFVYKESLFNGQYQQSTVDIQPQSITVDGAGNIYYFAGQNTTGVGLYALLLQPDGSYAPGNGGMQLPLPNLSNLVPNYTCGLGPPPGSIYFWVGSTVDGSGNLYFDSYIDCTNPYYPEKTFVGLFEYSSGITQPPIYVGSGGGGSYGVQVAELVGDARGNIFQYQGVGTTYYISEVSPAGYVLVTPSLGPLAPMGLATDAAGDVVIIGVNAGVETIYQLEYANPPVMSFQATPAGVESTDSPKEMTVTGISSQPVTLSSISYPPDFPEDLSFAKGYSGTCANGTTLSGNDNFCLVPIDFIPAQSLGNQGSLQLTEEVTLSTNSPASPALISVTGTEILPYAATPQASIPGGTYTAVQSVSLSDSTPGAAIYYTTNGTPPTINSTQYTGPITVSGTETIEAIATASGYSSSPVFSTTYTINLPPTFTLAASAPSLTISSEQSGTLTVSVTPQNGFNSKVSFGCSGLPSGASCSFSPASVTPSGGTATTTLTVSASAAGQASYFNLFPVFPATVLLFGLCCWSGRKRSRTRLALALLGMTLVTACSSGSSPGSQSTTSTVTITATSGALQQSTTFILTVQ